MNRPRVVTAILFFLQCWSRKRRKLRAGLAPQLGKQGKLEAFVRAWDRRYPHETEEYFEWRRQSLTLEQVALGRLDFRKFIVLLSALSQGSGGGYLRHSELQQEFLF